MAVHARLFNREKALEAILFIARKLQQPTMHSIAKMLYLADKKHLQDYGRLICGDRYIAMGYGPVPSAIYDMMKVPAGRSRIDPDVDEIIVEAFDIAHGRTVVPKREADTSLLAESEIACLDAAIEEHGRKSFGQLTDLTHDAAWDATDENQPIALSAIVRTLPNADELIAYLDAR
ncbi:MAG: Panacea domain-containing protein [Sterolibacteriaceae bacterium MAG5]|nr:Panacea domain-containing protein [Candidatus Nitricoxidireducens bremensis]